MRSPSLRQAALHAGPALADGPGVGTATVVSVGDSAISGEAGRWAGNTNGSPSNVDALGSTAYYDNAAGPARRSPAAIAPRRRRSRIGGGVASANLACSGARTYTQPFSSGSDFKPGLDFYDDGAGHIGQARRCSSYAATHNVKMVVALIGANDYGFADIVQQCVTDWLTSPSWWKNYCHDDSSMTAKFTAANVAADHDAASRTRFLNLRTAMSNAGYADGSWTLLAQTYSSPLPRGAQIRYSQNGFTRQTVGGCGVWNRDADWANDTVVATLNSTVRNAAAATGLTNIKVLRRAERARRPPPVREHRRPARGAGPRDAGTRPARRTARSGSRRSARRRRCSGPTSSRRTRTRPTGASWRCATACARPTTAAPRAAGTCSHTATGLNALGRAEHEPRLRSTTGVTRARATGKGRRASAVSACAVTHTGVWRARARVADRAVGGGRASAGRRAGRASRRGARGRDRGRAATSPWTAQAVDCAFDGAAGLQREAAVGVLARARKPRRGATVGAPPAAGGGERLQRARRCRRSRDGAAAAGEVEAAVARWPGGRASAPARARGAPRRGRPRAGRAMANAVVLTRPANEPSRPARAQQLARRGRGRRRGAASARPRAERGSCARRSPRSLELARRARGCSDRRARRADVARVAPGGGEAERRPAGVELRRGLRRRAAEAAVAVLGARAGSDGAASRRAAAPRRRDGSGEHERRERGRGAGAGAPAHLEARAVAPQRAHERGPEGQAEHDVADRVGDVERQRGRRSRDSLASVWSPEYVTHGREVHHRAEGRPASAARGGQRDAAELAARDAAPARRRARRPAPQATICHGVHGPWPKNEVGGERGDRADREARARRPARSR